MSDDSVDKSEVCDERGVLHEMQCAKRHYVGFKINKHIQAILREE